MIKDNIKPLPCPWCGGQVKCISKNIIVCQNCKIEIRSFGLKSKTETIKSFNDFCRGKQ